MPVYHKLGLSLKKTHAIWKTEEVLLNNFGTEGFSGNSALLYHVHRPTQVKEILKSYSVEPKIAGKKILNPYC
jgi:homogentisate 1,2-dioxygenase